MAFSAQIDIKGVFSRFASVLVCLCALTFLPAPHFSNCLLVETSDCECPANEHGEDTEFELIARSSARRSGEGHRVDFCYFAPRLAGRQVRLSCAECPFFIRAKTGHQYANGLLAPMLT